MGIAEGKPKMAGSQFVKKVNLKQLLEEW